MAVGGKPFRRGTRSAHQRVSDVDRRRFLKLMALSSGVVMIGCSSAEQLLGASTTTATVRAPVSDPINVAITRWRTEEFSRGSYSYLSLDNLPGNRELLAAHVDGKLFFAGEATSSSNPATVHGALMSGRDAAAAVSATAAPGARVAVIGAGSAGVGAARQLADEGFEVVVWEARDRIGGRVFTDHSTFGVPVDLGGSWIDGISGNPMWEIAQTLGVETVPTDYDSVRVYDSDGTLISNNVFNRPWRTVNGAAALGLTLEEAAALELEGASDREIHNFDFGAVTWIEQEYAADIVRLSADAPHEGDYTRGGDVLLPGGYVELIEFLADGLDIRTGSPITGIAWRSSPVLFVGDVTASADHVVVTIPLGVLKAGDVEFSPPLPANKQNAIDRFGMGLLDKVVLEFPAKFWDSTDWFGYASDDRGKCAAWYDLSETTGKPILLCFHADSAADDIAAKSDDEIVREAMTVLRTIYGS